MVGPAPQPRPFGSLCPRPCSHPRLRSVCEAYFQRCSMLHACMSYSEPDLLGAHTRMSRILVLEAPRPGQCRPPNEFAEEGPIILVGESHALQPLLSVSRRQDVWVIRVTVTERRFERLHGLQAPWDRAPEVQGPLGLREMPCKCEPQDGGVEYKRPYISLSP